MRFKLGDRVKTTADDNGDLFPVGTVGVIGDIDAGDPYPYKVIASNDYWWYTEDMLEPYEEKTYEQGLEDAWELAKKIVLNPIDNGLPNDEIKKIFDSEEGFVSSYWVMNNLSYEETLAKIEAYEKEKEIKVGDVVTNGKYICAVTKKIDENNSVILYGDGCFGKVENKFLEKTGKHIDIESLLRQIGE